MLSIGREQFDVARPGNGKRGLENTKVGCSGSRLYFPLLSTKSAFSRPHVIMDHGQVPSMIVSDVGVEGTGGSKTRRGTSCSN